MWNIIYEIWFACLFHCTCNRHHSVISVASSIWSHRSSLALMRASTAQCVASAVVIFLFSCQSSFSLTSCSSDSPFHLCELKTTTSSSTSKRWRRCSSTGGSLSFHVCPTTRAESPGFEDPASGSRAPSSHMFWSSCPETVLSGTSSSSSTSSSSGWLDGIVFTGASISSSGNSSSSGKLAGIDLNGAASFSTNSCKPACLSNGRLACRPISVRGLEDVDKSKKSRGRKHQHVHKKFHRCAYAPKCYAKSWRHRRHDTFTCPSCLGLGTFPHCIFCIFSHSKSTPSFLKTVVFEFKLHFGLGILLETRWRCHGHHEIQISPQSQNQLCLHPT